MLSWFQRSKLTFVTGITLVFCASSLAVPTTANAVSFHNYAIVGNGGATSGIIGLQQTRYDSIPSGIPSGTSCTTPYAAPANPMYQSEWVNQNSSATTWIEFGTGHQCSGYEFWYAGDGNGGIWNSQWTKTITGSGQHTFYLFRNTPGGTDTWHWQVDSTVENSWVSSWTGVDDVAGLESYDSGAASTYQITGLKYYTTSNTTWTAFSSDTIRQDSSMCIDLLSQTSANVGENVSTPANCT